MPFGPKALVSVTVVSAVSKLVKTKKFKLALVAAIAAGVQVLFPEFGETILHVANQLLGLVPELTLRT